MKKYLVGMSKENNIVQGDGAIRCKNDLSKLFESRRIKLNFKTTTGTLNTILMSTAGLKQPPTVLTSS